MLRVYSVVFLVGAMLVQSGQTREEKTAPKKKGTVVGILSTKGENWIEVKADGEEKGRRYVPHWRGGLPKDGGGLDKQMLAEFRKIKVGSRVRIEWIFEERPRVEKIELLNSTDGAKK